MYIIASADLGDIVAEVILEGPIKNPSIALRSNPPKTQKEVLSWLLFGHGLSEITPFQGSELTKSIANLKNGNKGTDLFTKVRKSIGIDRIDISRGEKDSNDVTLQVGKYISQGVFVSVNKNLTADANRLAIEANLMQNLKIQAEVGDDAEGKLHLKWKHDY
jgi:translocation and assembly module TamB